MHGDSLGYTDSKAHGSDKVIKLVCTDGKLLGTILGNVDGIILIMDVRPELSSLDISFDGSNDVKLEGLLHGDSLVSTDGKVIGSY